MGQIGEPLREVEAPAPVRREPVSEPNRQPAPVRTDEPEPVPA